MYEAKTESAYKAVCDAVGESRVIGVFLCGSQNYNLDDEMSNTDYVALIAPTLDNLIDCVRDNTDIATEFGHITVKDFRLAFNSMLSQNLQFLEILFTEIYKVNPMYKEDWDVIVSNKESIARYNTVKFVNYMAGTMKNYIKGIKTPEPTNTANYGWNGKCLHRIIHMYRTLVDYTTNCYTDKKSFGDMIKYSNEIYMTRESLIALKRDRLVKYDGSYIQSSYDADKIANTLHYNAQTIADSFIKAKNHEMMCKQNVTKIDSVFKSVTSKIVRKSAWSELND